MQNILGAVNVHKSTKFFTMLFTLTASMVVSAADNANDQKIAIDMSQLATTKNEVAVLQVLSEICPPMLTKSQQAGFINAYNYELKNLMPSINDPRLAVQYLSTQQDYKQILDDTRQWTLSFPKSENKAVCTELANAKY